METDEQLVVTAQEGSEVAFNELVLRYREKLFRFLLTRCASHADAEDAVQDTFVNVYRYLHSFNPRWRFSTWLYRIAIRNLSHRPLAESNTNDDLVDDADPLEQCLIHCERENLWLTAKRILAPPAFMAMWLHYVEDMPMKEVACALDRSISWTKVTLFRARRRLMKELRDEAAVEAGSSSYG